MVLLATPALAHDVPNTTGWHTHDGVLGDPAHHKPVLFFPALFAAEGLGVYGTDVGFLDCPDATDKGLLPHGAQGTVHAAGMCMNDAYIVHLLSGVDAPRGWTTISFGGVDYHYRLTARG
jgi:hypothetical protein